MVGPAVSFGVVVAVAVGAAEGEGVGAAVGVGVGDVGVGVGEVSVVSLLQAARVSRAAEASARERNLSLLTL